MEQAPQLREAMAELAEGRGFLLQGGDCAESFDDPVAEQVAGIVGLFDAMAEQLRCAVNGTAGRGRAHRGAVRKAPQCP